MFLGFYSQLCPKDMNLIEQHEVTLNMHIVVYNNTYVLYANYGGQICHNGANMGKQTKLLWQQSQLTNKSLEESGN